MEWVTDRAEHAINLLNLNNQDLCKRRKNLIDNLYKWVLELDLEFNKESLILFIDNSNSLTLQAKELYRYISNKLIEN